MTSFQTGTIKNSGFKVALFALGIAFALTASMPTESQANSKREDTRIAKIIQKALGAPKDNSGNPSTQGGNSVSCHADVYGASVCPSVLKSECDKHGGGMSVEDGGTYTCSGPFSTPRL